MGVVGDVRQELSREPDPLIYMPLAQGDRGFYKNWGMDVMLRTAGNPPALTDSVRNLVAGLDGMLPVFRVSFMEELVAASAARRRFGVVLVGLFAGVALLLAAVGTYGVIAHSVQQRTQEFGVRMVLGASRRDILGMVLRQGTFLTLAGLAAGLAGALLLTRVLESLLYQITPTDPLTFVLVSTLLAAVALLACYLPASRATRVDPMNALRHE